MLNELKTFFIALQFFTRLPVTGALGQWAEFSVERLNASARYFPLVGGLVGACCAAAMALTGFALGSSGPINALITSLVGLAAGLWVTGAFHEDGLADTADALGGHVSRERALEIMRDSRLGTYGVTALVLALLLKILLVAALLTEQLELALVTVFIAHAASRVPPLWLMRWLRHVGDSPTSKAKPLAQHISTRSLTVGSACGLGIALIGCAVAAMSAKLANGAPGLNIGPWCSPQLQWFAIAFAGTVSAVVVVSLSFKRWLRARLGGFTGDTLGAAQQVCELLLYAVVLKLATPR